MIELGVVNVLGTRRIDTLYDPDDPKLSQANAPECKKDSTQPCIEVLLELSSFWTRVSTSQVAGGEIALVARKFGKEPPVTDGGIQTYGGHVITDGSTYAPQMPWYMSHYCQSTVPRQCGYQDPVCYADYLSPMNTGFSPLQRTAAVVAEEWPLSVMNGTRFPAPTNHCPPGAPPCTIALAAIRLDSGVVDLDRTPVPEVERLPDPVVQPGVGCLPRRTSPTSRTRASLRLDHQDRRVGRLRVSPGACTTPSRESSRPRARSSRTPGIQLPTHVYLRFRRIQRLHQHRQPVRASSSCTRRQCSLNDLSGAAEGDLAKVAKLRNCSLAYETPPQWLQVAVERPGASGDRLWGRLPGGEHEGKPVRQDVLRVRRRSRHAAAGVVPEGHQDRGRPQHLREGLQREHLQHVHARCQRRRPQERHAAGATTRRRSSTTRCS